MNSAEPEMPPRLAAQRLVAVPWRHAGLIAACAVVGGLASTMLWLPPAPERVATARPHVQAIQDAPSEAAAGIDLRLDLDPGATQVADASPPPSTPPQWDDEIDAALRQAPPAAGVLMPATPEPARPDATLPGLVAGLLLGLLIAGLRELRGQRMRSAREAEWALGAPVLGAIPTLSARARGALLEPADAA
jgi:hypothetical protein